MKKIIIVTLLLCFVFTINAQPRFFQFECIGDANCNGIFDPTENPAYGTITYTYRVGNGTPQTITSSGLMPYPTRVSIVVATNEELRVTICSAPINSSIKIPNIGINGPSNCEYFFPAGQTQNSMFPSVFLVCWGNSNAYPISGCSYPNINSMCGQSGGGSGGTSNPPSGSQIDSRIDNNSIDTTSLTTFCSNPGFEDGQQLQWQDWHGAYGVIGSNSNSIDILSTSDYAFLWGIKETGITGAEIQNQTNACNTYPQCNYDNYPGNTSGSNTSAYLQKNQIHHLVVPAGNDPIVPTLTKTHNNSTFSLRLGNSASNNGFEFVEKKFLVTPATSKLSFWYASVMSNPQHGAGEDQYFGVDVFNINNNTLTKLTNNSGGVTVNLGTNTNYTYSSDNFSQTYNRNRFCTPTQAITGGIKYRDWSYVTIDLTSQMNNTVVIRFWTRDCSRCGDFAYAYLDDFCSEPAADNPTGFIQISNTSDNCGVNGKICVSYNLPQATTGTGTVKLLLKVFQNGNTTPIHTLQSNTLSSSSTNPYCFNINSIPQSVFQIGSTHFDYSVEAQFSYNNVACNNQILGTPGAGTINGNNNDFERVCPLPPCNLTITETYTNPTCGRPNGEIDITVTGGTGPYTYSWDEGSNTEDRTQLVAGIHTITVTDANGCSATKSITLTNNSPFLSFTGSVTNTTCGNNNGAILITPTGGTPPLTYNWTGGLTGQNPTNVPPGTYDLRITDSKGCNTLIESFTVAASSKPIITETHINPICTANNGSINITVTGGTAPYTYVWGDGSGLEDRTNLNAGTHTVTVTDASGCAATKQILISATTVSFDFDLQYQNEYCGNQNGAVGINPANIIGGTAPFTYTWKKNGVIMNGQTAVAISALSAGTYQVEVKDANGCIVTKTKLLQNATATLNVQSTVINVTCLGPQTGQIVLTSVTGGDNYTFTWTRNGITLPQTGQYLTNVTVGTYTVTVKDGDTGCSIVRTFTITQDSCPQDCCIGGQWKSKYIGWSLIRDVVGVSASVIGELKKLNIPETEIETPVQKNLPAKTTATNKIEIGNAGPIGPKPTRINIANCGPDAVYHLSQNGTYTLNADYLCGTAVGFNCTKTIKVTIQGPPGCTFNGTYNAPYTQTFTQDGNYTITYEAYCGTVVCGTCTFTLVIDKNCCLGGRWLGANYQIVNKNANGSWNMGTPQPLPLTISSPIPTYTAQVAVNILNLNYQCATGCTTGYKVIKRNTVTGVQTTTILPAGQTSLSVYTEKDKQLIRIWPICGSQQCQPMLMFFVACSTNSCKTIGNSSANNIGELKKIN